MDSAARRNPELSAARRATASGALRKRLTGAGRSRGGSFTPTIKANALPRPGDLRSAAISLSRGQIPQGSLLGNIVNTVGRAISGGRAGVPRHVAPVPAPAMNSITPNMVNQSDVGRTLKGALRRRMGTRTMRPIPKPRSGGTARTM